MPFLILAVSQRVVFVNNVCHSSVKAVIHISCVQIYRRFVKKENEKVYEDPSPNVNFFVQDKIIKFHT
jgi:hypothetical protein